MARVFMWSMRLGSWKRGQVSLYTCSAVYIHKCKSKCPRLATGAPWHVSNRRIHEHGSSSLVDLAIADAGPCSPLLSRRAKGSNLSQNICRVAVLGQGSQSGLWCCRQTAEHPDTRVLDDLCWLKYSVTFLSCEANTRWSVNTRVYDLK